MNAPKQMATLRLQSVERAYKQGSRVIKVLNGASAAFFPGQAVALLGPSGAGKSTLLHIAGLLERPDSGAVMIDGVDSVELGDKDRTQLRRSAIGFVYQFHHLLPEFTALENIMLPQLILGLSRSEAESRANALLSSLGLSERIDHRPAQLSGGEQQRVAIARAVANAPRVLLADEPTGNLDPHTAERVFDELLSLVRQSGVSAVIATHNLELAAKMDRTLRLVEGSLVEEGAPAPALSEA